MPDLQHFCFPYRMNPLLGQGLSAHAQHHACSPTSVLQESLFTAQHSSTLHLGEHFGPGLIPDVVSHVGLPYLPLAPYLPRMVPPPPATMALRNDLGSNISVLKTLNLRFRCFLAKVHELERRNKTLEKQLQQVLKSNANVPQETPQRPTTLFNQPLKKSQGTDCDPGGNPAITVSLCTPTNAAEANTNNSNNTPSRPTTHPPVRCLPGTIWSYSPRKGSEPRVPTSPGVSWVHPDGVGVQIDTITPEIRALYNVLGKVRRERDEYRRR